MHESWKFEASRVSGSVDYLTIEGKILEESPWSDSTAHHIINIQVLQDVWNCAVDERDEEVFRALAVWSAFPEGRLNAILQSPASGGKEMKQFRKYVCWNPFNIVVGPSTTWRVGDPGEANKDPVAHGFDNIKYDSAGRVSPDKSNAGAVRAKLEFNEHIERLRRINQYMRRYCKGEFQQDTDSLKTLLKSDAPSKYSDLFAQLRKMMTTAGRPETDKQKDDELVQASDARIRAAQEAGRRVPRPYISRYSPDVLPGSLIDPVLWLDYTEPKSGFAKAFDKKLHSSRIKEQKVIPWVSSSYLPAAKTIAPASRFEHTREKGLHGLPYRQAMEAIPYSHQLLSRASCMDAVKAKVNGYAAKGNKGRSIPLAPKQILLRCIVVGPTYRGPMSDITDSVAEAITDLVKTKGYQLLWASYADKNIKRIEIRFYYF